MLTLPASQQPRPPTGISIVLVTLYPRLLTQCELDAVARPQSLLRLAPLLPRPALPALPQLVRAAAGADWNLSLVPVSVALKRVQDLLRVWVNQVRPGLPQRVHDVVDEANLRPGQGLVTPRKSDGKLFSLRQMLKSLMVRK